MKKIAACCLFTFLVLSSAFAQETITITTYYPAPFGVYRELRMLKQAEGQEIQFNNNGTRGQPNIDFSNMAGGQPFDWRLVLMGDNQFRIRAGSAGGEVLFTRLDATGNEVYGPVRFSSFLMCTGNVN